MPRKAKGCINWFPRDHLADAELAMCSLAAQGLWSRMVQYMALSETVGHLLVAGRRVDVAMLAHLIGKPLGEVQGCLEELERYHVFSRTRGGVAYNRRLVKDARRSQQNYESGKMGGNPMLLEQTEISETVNPLRNNPDKVARASPTPTPSLKESIPTTESVAASREGVSDFDLGEGVVRAAKAIVQLGLPHNLIERRLIGSWLRNYDLQLDILPAIRHTLGERRGSTGKPNWAPANLAYFSQPIDRYRVTRVLTRKEQ